MSRRVSTIVGSILCLGLLGAFAQAKTVVTADTGTLTKHGDQVSVALRNNVRLTSTDGNTVLTGQRLTAAGTSQAIDTARVDGSPSFSRDVIISDTTYHLVIRAYFIEYDKDKIIFKTGKGGAGRPQLSLTPVDQQQQERVTLQANLLEFYPNAEDATQRPAIFLRATGNAQVMAISKGRSGGADGYQRFLGKAAVISGEFAGFAGIGDAADYTQVFRLGQGANGGARPHIELAAWTPAAPNQDPHTKLDANAIVYYPEVESFAKTWWADGAHSNTATVTLLAATGNASFSSVQHMPTKAQPATSTGKSKLGGASFTPVNQLWQGENGDLTYQLVRGVTAGRLFDHVMRWTAATGGTGPGLTMTDLDTGEKPLIVPKGYTTTANLDAGSYRIGEESTEEGQ